ncbi:LysR family transcriptional regulator [Undibacterium sp. Rencai35W]|uniref:LysR family transcriptional regulator n=1 Tax=Undibacterium sp. Rencai35W TaxID=3413046 RepID=UPI003BF11144
MSHRPSDHLDTNLLRVLHTLLTERSVTRTAMKLGQSQPAISNMLKRLREITGDAILVRGKNGMTATERGEELLLLAKQGLSVLESIAHPAPSFVPAQTQRVFHLGAPDYLSVLLIPLIMEKIRGQAPHAGLVIHSLNAGFDYASALETGELDCVIGNWPEQPPHLHLAHLFEDELVCMVNHQHPIVKKGLSLKYYLEMPHLAPTPYMMGHRSIIDSALAEQGLKRHIQMTIPYFGMVPDVLARTDLIFTTSRSFAMHFVGQYPIAVLPMPVEMPKMRFFMLWHERSHAATEVQWLRRIVADASREAMGATSVASAASA